MVMWKTKSCPKCGGDLFIDSEDHIVFGHCLQCSYTRAYNNVKCPGCGSSMVFDAEAGEKELRCERCGQTIDLNPVASAK